MPEITIKWGDTLSALAQKHGTTVQKLAELNGITNVNLIYAGATLKLPGDDNQTAGGNNNATSGNNRSTARLPGGTEGAPTPTNGQPVDPAKAVTAQAGKAPYINQYDASISNGPSNCGPTSMAMIARAYGYGQGLSDGQLIADLGKAGGTNGDGTGWGGIEAMAKRMGKPVQSSPPNAEWIKQQLQAGKLVCANGDYFAMPPHDAGRIGQGGHYVAIVGMDANGNFLVNDPADRGISPKAFTPAQIERFMRANNNGGRAFAIG